MTDSLGFVFSEPVRALGVCGSYLTIRNLHNRSEDAEFTALRARRLQVVATGLTEAALDSDPLLKGFHDLHRKVGKEGDKYMSSPENLLRYLLRTGTLPQINLLVDIYNLVSVESRLALGAHDLGHIVGNVHLRLTDGTEGFWPLGYGKAKKVGKGDYAYVDDGNDVLCWLEVRQVEKTKITSETRGAFFIVQGNETTNATTITKAAQEIVSLVTRFCGGEVEFLAEPERR